LGGGREDESTIRQDEIVTTYMQRELEKQQEASHEDVNRRRKVIE
jgi:hypothetical protein